MAVMEVISTHYKYERLEEIGIGQGRNSTVYRSRDTQLGGEIAVKEVPKDQFGDSDKFFAEARIMSEAQCPNVVPIRLASTAGNHICLVMPHLTNGSLASRIEKHPLRLSDVIRVGQGMLKGLSQIHCKGIIHFDIKPSNVLFSDNGEALVADFGQSRRVGTSGLSLAPPMYTVAMPPEVIEKNHGTIETDIYQAGLTLYRALNGDADFQRQILCAPQTEVEFFTYLAEGKLPSRSHFLPHVPQWLRNVIRKALNVDPKDRYNSASTFANDLGRNAIPIDWETTIGADGKSVVWRGQRPKRATLEVRRIQTNKKCDVEVYAAKKDGTWVKKGTAVYWRPQLKPKDADNYLKQLFRQLA